MDLLIQSECVISSIVINGRRIDTEYPHCCDEAKLR